MDFLGDLYDLIFGWLYSLDMADYLAGVSDTGESTLRYPGLWLTAFVFPLIVTLLFYKLLDSPKTNRWWIWLLVGIGNSFLVWAWTAWGYFGELNDGLMPTKGSESAISDVDIWGLASAQWILAFFFFFVLSLCVKFISTNNCFTPFKFLQK